MLTTFFYVLVVAATAVVVLASYVVARVPTPRVVVLSWLRVGAALHAIFCW